jgi:hypothetical protein
LQATRLCPLQPPQRGDVAEDQHRSEQIPGGIADWRAAIVNGDLGAVAAAQYRMIGKPDDVPFAQGLEQWEPPPAHQSPR